MLSLPIPVVLIVLLLLLSSLMHVSYVLLLIAMSYDLVHVV